MKNFIPLILLFVTVLLPAQEKARPDLKNMSPEQRKEYIRQLPPEQRKKLMEKMLANMATRNLMVPFEKQEAFKKLLKEYHESQKAIKDKFKPLLAEENFSDADAKKVLDQSFELGQQLLDLRKTYAEKFMKILTPQQVLRLFSEEKKMQEKMKDRREPGRAQKARGPEGED